MIKLPALQEMLELNEAGIVASFRAGYADAKHRHDHVARTLRADDRASRGTRTSDEQTDDDAPASPRTPAPRAKSKEEILQDVSDDMTQFIQDFFKKFPNARADNGTSAAIIQNYPSKEAREAAAKAYRALSVRVKELRVGFNKSLVKSNMISLQQATNFAEAAKRTAGAASPTPHRQLIKFVRKESAFFIRLVRVNGNGQLLDNDFKQLLALKVRQTDPSRVPDAAQALNLLFGYMEYTFKEHAKVIEKAVDDSEEAARQARIAARRAPTPEPDAQ